MSARMELHVALSMRLDAIEAHRLANAYRAEVLAEHRATFTMDDARGIARNHRAAVIGQAADWLASVGETNAAYLLRTCDVPTSVEKDTPTGATSTPAEQIVYRAAYEHESIPLGLYTTQAAARAHCEAQLSSEYPPHVSVIHDWIGDDSDPLEPWELVAEIGGGEEQPTGYVVTPLTVATEYDPEAEG